MRTYELLPREAGVRLYVEAGTLEELFKGTLNGLADAQKKGSCEIKVETLSKIMKIESLDQTTLLVDFLSDVINYSREEKAIYCRVKILKLEEKTMEAEIYGRVVETGFNTEIKAVKCDGGEIRKNEKGNWEVTVAFNI